ncbi:LCP family protein [Actinocorallia longicatena]|uniref:Cell envelope-related transcriptional attenuator domain-containing protein n=1 Tax=Actinocorallia longicatena TaxID=111803 RepID=A0ABP6QJY3_9ACTN
MTWRGLGLVVGSAFVWGLAQFATGLRRFGALLLGLEIALLAGAGVLAGPMRDRVAVWLVQPRWLDALSIVLAAVAVLWVGVIFSAFWVVRPATSRGRILPAIAAVVMSLVVALPLARAAELAQTSKGVVTSVFASSSGSDAWKGKKRVNLLLIGADAAPGRPGVRTDSMTVASLDTEKGKTTLFSLPRNLEDVPMPTEASRAAFPDGFAGDGTEGTPALLNEVYQWAEDHPDIVPGVPAGERGETLLKATVGGILGLEIDYYAMIDMKGFAQLVDAVGGITVKIDEDLVYGRNDEGLIRAGTRRLTGDQALWFGRTRTGSSDYARMSRQKCLLYGLEQQADPMTVLTRFNQIASAAKRAVSTDIPRDLLPALVQLSQKEKGLDVKSVQFIPPLISTANPDWDFIQDKVDSTLNPVAATAHVSAVKKKDEESLADLCT